MKILKLVIILLFITSNHLKADVLLTLEANLIRPACSVSVGHGSNALNINFFDVERELLSEGKKSFEIAIDSCDLKKNLGIYLSPKEGSILTVNNETVLETSTRGLGIRFTQENNDAAINLQMWEPIFPTIRGRIALLQLHSQLVTSQAIETLKAGPFNASLSIMVDYY
ncbi:fimbrial protein [Providencia stuartii]|uniref:fimbrial protein n=1 Tax=Providencia rettgeri TaxID=587 RepID=UPI00200A1073|nr:fimbrial protein [Providencia rettgeri]ELR5075376.1 fimbrial protein [Providencia stuartii]UPS63801.1 fimbrial protein [Providencia rettgeri]